MKLWKITIAVMAATVLLGILGAAASARNLSVSSQSWGTSFRSFSFNLPFGNIFCQVSLSGSLHTRTIAKSPGTLIGYINRATLGACSSGNATVLTETLPWHVTYRSFTGTLPNITSIGTNIINFSFRYQEPAFIVCLARSTTARPAIGIFTVANRVIASTNISGTIPSDCGTEFVLSSDAGPVATTVGGTTRITVTLI